MEQPTDAFIFVQTERWGTSVADRLRTIPGIVAADEVSGPYDALALARTAEGGAGIDPILDAVRDVPGVLRAIAAPLTPTKGVADPRVDAA